MAVSCATADLFVTCGLQSLHEPYMHRLAGNLQGRQRLSASPGHQVHRGALTGRARCDHLLNRLCRRQYCRRWEHCTAHKSSIERLLSKDEKHVSLAHGQTLGSKTVVCRSV